MPYGVETELDDVKTSRAECDATHAGFLIMCDKCGSTSVFVFSNYHAGCEDCSGFGGVYLVCNNCKYTLDTMETAIHA